MRVSIVIPTYNEKENLFNLTQQIFQLNLPGLEIIVVDDNSKDGTANFVNSIKEQFPITLISRPKKLGLGNALKAGLKLALERGADIVITMDADLSHNPTHLSLMIEKIQQGSADVVIGSRRIKNGAIVGWGWGRTFMSKGAMETARKILKIKTLDVTSGFRAYSRNALEKINIHQLCSTGYAFQEEILFYLEQTQTNILEIPIIFHDRQHGKSKLGLKDIFGFFWTVARLRLNKHKQYAQ